MGPRKAAYKWLDVGAYWLILIIELPIEQAVQTRPSNLC